MMKQMTNHIAYLLPQKKHMMTSIKTNQSKSDMRAGWHGLGRTSMVPLSPICMGCIECPELGQDVVI